MRCGARRGRRLVDAARDERPAIVDRGAGVPDGIRALECFEKIVALAPQRRRQLRGFGQVQPLLIARAAPEAHVIFLE